MERLRHILSRREAAALAGTATACSSRDSVPWGCAAASSRSTDMSQMVRESSKQETAKTASSLGCQSTHCSAAKKAHNKNFTKTEQHMKHLSPDPHNADPTSACACMHVGGVFSPHACMQRPACMQAYMHAGVCVGITVMGCLCQSVSESGILTQRRSKTFTVPSSPPDSSKCACSGEKRMALTSDS